MPLQTPKPNQVVLPETDGAMAEQVMDTVEAENIIYAYQAEQVGTAHAAVSPTHPLPKPSIRTLANRVLAQNSQFAVVVCQKFMSDKRTMKRHVKVSGQCYDEFVDTFTGNIKRRQKTSCKRGCG